MVLLSLPILLSVLGVVVGLIALAAVVWFFPVKLWFRIRRRRRGPNPCPYDLGWILNLKFRRWCYRRVVENMPLNNGSVVLDVGAGTGTFTLPIAERVGPGGKVVAVDIQPEMIAELRKRVASAGLTNVEAHVCAAEALSVKDDSVDCAVFIGVLGEVPDQEGAIREVHRVLRSGGLVSITETFFDPDYNWPKELERLLTAAGFSIREKLGGFWLYTIIARKD